MNKDINHMILPQISDAGIASYSEKGITKSRRVDCFEIELPLDKTGVSHINSQNTKIDTNIIICAKPGQTRYTELPFRCYYIHLSLNSGFLYNKLMKTPDFIKTERHTAYRGLLEKISHYRHTSHDTSEIIIQGLVLEMIFYLLQDAESANNIYPGRSYTNDIIVEALKYIDNHPECELSLDTLAQKSGLSPIHFHNCFKKYTGKTLRIYVEDRRIQKAINMISQTNYTLARIAYDCGFSSQSYFNYAFKRKTGYTPRSYVKNFLGFE